MPETGLELNNHRLDNVVASPIRAFNNQLVGITDLIPLTVGELDFDVAENVKRAAIRAIETEDAHYVPSNGKTDLLQALAKDLVRTTGVQYNPATEIVVSLGVSEGLYATLQGLFNPGDAIVLPTPTFSLYGTQATMLGIEVVEVNTAPTFVMTGLQLRQTVSEHPNVKALALNSPGNPTGVVYSEEALLDLTTAARDLGILIISDEIYADFTYDTTFLSIARFLPEQTIVLNGLSKSHAMPGYRIGYVAGPAKLMAYVSRVHRAVVTTAPNPMMTAAAAAIEHGWSDLQTYRTEMTTRRNMVLEYLKLAGLEHVTVAGALYAFIKIPERFGADDVAFALQMAHEAKVGVIPGSVFGSGGEGYIRLSFAVNTEKLREALQRMTDFLKEN